MFKFSDTLADQYGVIVELEERFVGEALRVPQREETRVNIREIYTNSKKEKYKPAHMGKRFVAFGIDCVIAAILNSVVTILIINKIFQDSTLNSIAFFAHFFLVIPLLYWCPFTMKFGATPGKKMMGLKVIRDDQGTKLNLKNIILRETAGRMASGLLFCVGYFIAFKSSDKITWHDKMSKTRVVEFK